jgi:hypothetical protein
MWNRNCAFMKRSRMYRQWDHPALGTRFFGAAALVTGEIGLLQRGFAQPATVEWLESLSSLLENENSAVLKALRGYAVLPVHWQGLHGDALDRAVVHHEQGIVQRELERLAGAGANAIINDINQRFREVTSWGARSVILRALGDGASIRAAAAALRRVPDFRRQTDREAIGMAAVDICRRNARA